MIKQWAEQFFRWYCRPEYFADIRGDLDELFHRQMDVIGARQAEWYFAYQVLLLFRPSIIRPFSPWGLNHTDMIRTYFKIGFRNLRKHRSTALIHIFGLALGLAAFLLIHQYKQFEESYDSFHPTAERLYRLTTDDILDGRIQVRDAMSFAPSGKLLLDEAPEVTGYTTTLKTWRMVFKKGEQPIEELNTIAVDEHFLDLFGYEVLRGDKASMLVEPYSIVLSESQARKYFDGADPMGQSLEVLGQFERPFEVTGIIADPPQNTHYTLDMLVSLQSFQEQIERDEWDGYNYYTYLQLAPGTDTEVLEKKLEPLAKQYIGEESRLFFNLQPIQDIHLHSDFTYEPEIHGSAKAVGFLGIISIFILVIAWVNYINLSTARALERAQEVGLRKVVGAQRRHLLGQFLIEALLINFAGAVVALLLAQLLIPYFNQLVGKTILTSAITNWSFLSGLTLFFLIGVLATGLYPALVISSFQPMSVLRGSFGRTKKGAFLRKSLVVVQFAASLLLIAGTVTIYQQIRYMTGSDLGIDTEQVIGFENPQPPDDQREQFESKYETFLSELDRLQLTEGSGSIGNLPGGGSSDISSSSGGVRIVGMTDRQESTVYITSMNDRLADVLELEFISGRNFDRELASDSSAVILNQSFLQLLNISEPESVIDQHLQFGNSPDNRRWLIAGVINDYNRSTLKNNVEPTIFFHEPTPSATVVKIAGNSVEAGIEQVKGVWSRMFPDAPFTYSFLDQRFEKLYMEDRRFGLIFLNFAILAILVASLGLFGLSSYMSLQRTKEVGVRKVLGASVANIVLLFFKDFLWLILIAAAIGIPLTYLGMTDWLSSYANRIDFPWWVLSLAIIAVIMLAFFTVSYQTWKLAILNPARTIRHE